ADRGAPGRALAPLARDRPAVVNWIPRCGTIGVMPGPASSSRFTRFLVGLPLLSACAAGSDDGLTGFSSAAYTAGPVGDSGDGETEGDSDGSGSASADGSGSASADGTSTSGGGDDGGNPLCCEPGGQAGCGSD